MLIFTMQIIDSLNIIWPDGTKTKMVNPEADQLLEIDQNNAKNFIKPVPDQEFQFKSIDSLLKFTHQENKYKSNKDN
mgnify:CR=1 FL=1